jgi:SAM-dependent methyltransferase
MAMTDMTQGIGLEIGPLDSPIALKARSDVRYVDIVGSTALHEKYRDDPNVEAADIVDVDFALQDPDGGIHSLPEVAGRDGPYDWVVASHVIEHVPDLIAWLDEIGQVTVDGGHLVLMIPDRRFTFDVLRSQTTIGQILQAHTTRDVVPSERAVYDHFRSYVDVPTTDLWSGRPGIDYPRVFSVDRASALRSQVLATGEYIDSHVWLFTPAVFVEQIVELGTLGLCDFVVEAITPTLVNDLEFFASLRRLPRGLTADQRREEQTSGVQSLTGDRSQQSQTSQPTSAVAGDPDHRPGEHSLTAVEWPKDNGVSRVALSDHEVRLIRLKRRTMERIRSLLGSDPGD